MAKSENLSSQVYSKAEDFDFDDAFNIADNAAEPAATQNVFGMSQAEKLKKIHSGTKEEQKQKLAEFKYELARQKKGIAEIQANLLAQVKRNPNASAENYMESVQPLFAKFKLSSDQVAAFENSLKSYVRTHEIIEEKAKECRDKQTGKVDGPMLYEKLFNHKPEGRIEVIFRPAMIYFRTENLNDYAFAYKNGEVKDSFDSVKEQADRSSGCMLVDFKVLGLENAIALENSTNGKFDAPLDEETFQHEEQHVLNSVIKQGYDAEEIKTEKRMDLFRIKFGAPDEYDKELSEKYIEIKNDRNITIESRAKDEISAFFKEGQTPEYIRETLLKPDTIYKFGFEYKGGDEKTLQFSQAYIDLIEKGIAAYSDLLASGSSVEDVQGLLFVEPLSKWPKVVERMAEAKAEMDPREKKLLEELNLARKEFVEMDLKKTGMWERVQRWQKRNTLQIREGIETNIVVKNEDGSEKRNADGSVGMFKRADDADVTYMQALYDNALINYKNLRIDNIQEMKLSPEATNEEFKKLTIEIGKMERISLMDEKLEAKAKEMQGTTLEKGKSMFTKFMGGYKKLGFKKQMYITVGLIAGTSAATAAAVAGIAGGATLATILGGAAVARRFVGGASTGMLAFGAAEGTAAIGRDLSARMDANKVVNEFSDAEVARLRSEEIKGLSIEQSAEILSREITEDERFSIIKSRMNRIAFETNDQVENQRGNSLLRAAGATTFGALMGSGILLHWVDDHTVLGDKIRSLLSGIKDTKIGHAVMGALGIDNHSVNAPAGTVGRPPVLPHSQVGAPTAAPSAGVSLNAHGTPLLHNPNQVVSSSTLPHADGTVATGHGAGAVAPEKNVGAPALENAPRTLDISEPWKDARGHVHHDSITHRLGAYLRETHKDIKNPDEAALRMWRDYMHDNKDNIIKSVGEKEYNVMLKDNMVNIKPGMKLIIDEHNPLKLHAVEGKISHLHAHHHTGGSINHHESVKSVAPAHLPAVDATKPPIVPEIPPTSPQTPPPGFFGIPEDYPGQHVGQLPPPGFHDVPADYAAQHPGVSYPSYYTETIAPVYQPAVFLNEVQAVNVPWVGGPSIEVMINSGASHREILGPCLKNIAINPQHWHHLKDVPFREVVQSQDAETHRRIVGVVQQFNNVKGMSGKVLPPAHSNITTGQWLARTASLATRRR